MFGVVSVHFLNVLTQQPVQQSRKGKKKKKENRKNFLETARVVAESLATQEEGKKKRKLIRFEDLQERVKKKQKKEENWQFHPRTIQKMSTQQIIKYREELKEAKKNIEEEDDMAVFILNRRKKEEEEKNNNTFS
eukprot:TRINITY_DN4182_c0_g1_i3.p1 TRINITY_DN4182_c0_g1~~TRINITY_DN4182_c0_g1_i3.p1  ORF type:complete len:135 (-),score=30.01 TRINITY_DN4182_c0_g1_i3:68-472(-)